MLLTALLLAFNAALAAQPDVASDVDARAALEFQPVSVRHWRIEGARLAGAWRIRSDDRRFGGVSALAVDRGALLALTDAGVAIRFRPGGRAATLFDLPGLGPRKAERDAEAIAPAGEGWWVAFENLHAVRRYDRGLSRVLEEVSLGDLGLRPNRGLEALARDGGGLVAIPELGDRLVRIAAGRAAATPIAPIGWGVADAARLPDGRLLLVLRRIGPGGFSTRLALWDGRRAQPIASLALGRLDNVEALAVEPRPGGATRLWLMTDDNQRRWMRTLLIVLDLPGVEAAA